MIPAASGKPTRRAVLRSAAVVATAAASSGVLAACAGGAGTKKTALPGPANGGIVLNFAPNWQGTAWSSTAQELNQQFIDKNYNAKHTGVYVKVQPPLQGQGQQVIAAALAGSATADVFQDCCDDLPALESAGLLTPLDTYLQQDNVDMNIWLQRHLQVLTYNGKIMALPAYDGPVTMFYRQDILDELGLPYPDPNWTLADAQKLWATVSKPSGKTPRYGVNLFVTPFDWELDWWLRGWGTSLTDASRTQCLVDDPKGIAMLSFLQDVSVHKIASTAASFTSGTCVFQQQGGWQLLPAVLQLGNRVKWNILPNPVWPAGRATWCNIDFYVLNSATKHPTHAWELLKWVCADPAYQTFQMQTTLVQPCLLSLFEQWQTTVLQAAPPLAGKDVQYISQAATQNYAYPQIFFEYSVPETITVMNQWGNQIWSGQIDPTTGARQMTHQINALQSLGVAGARSVTASTQYPTPPKKGAGAPFVPADPFIVETNGVVTMLGMGYDVTGTEDACTFFCAADTRAKAEYTCRVTGVANISCPGGISPWVKLGLMARADLSDDAPMVTVHVTGANDIEWEYREIVNTDTSYAAGLVPAGMTGAMMSSVGTPTANYLVKPIWLRLSRDGLVWTAYSSLDGTKWTQMGQPQTCDMQGCWVGIMCTAHNGDFGNKGYVRGAVDNLGISPALDTKVQLGVHGVYPKAGPVPTDWAGMHAPGVAAAQAAEKAFPTAGPATAAVKAGPAAKPLPKTGAAQWPVNPTTAQVQAGYSMYATHGTGTGFNLEMVTFGNDIQGNADNFSYFAQQAQGAGTWSVQLGRFATTGGWAKAGIMLRQTLDPGSANLFFLSAVNVPGTQLQWRSAANGGTSYSASTDSSGAVLPVYLRVQYTPGKQVVLTTSTDGKTWGHQSTVPLVAADPTTKQLPKNAPSGAIIDPGFTSPYYVGVAACAHDTGSQGMAGFTSFTGFDPTKMAYTAIYQTGSPGNW